MLCNCQVITGSGIWCSIQQSKIASALSDTLQGKFMVKSQTLLELGAPTGTEYLVIGLHFPHDRQKQKVAEPYI